MSGFAWLETLGPQRIRPGLDRTRALLESLGRPDRTLRPVLIAGTNGKGSTAAALSSVLTQAGIRAGLYTSPHLVRVTERLRTGDEDVPAAILDDVLALIAAVSGPDERGPTYFEALTVAALEIFRRERVEVAVLEVGIGGRLDATNVVEPEVSIVTNVGADHLEVLGPTLADVAREKAGVFRRGQPALVGAEGSAPEAMAVLHAEAARTGARLLEIPADARFEKESPLPGRHQRSNLSLAVAAARSIAPLSEETVLRGIRAVRWPGRLQLVPRAGKRPLLLDGAHNPDGARALAAYLDEQGLSGRVDLLFGVMGDKNVVGIAAPLLARARRVVFAAVESPRAAPAPSLKARLGQADAEAASSVADALRRLDEGGERDAPILVAGSLYLVGDVLGLLAGRSG